MQEIVLEFVRSNMLDIREINVQLESLIDKNSIENVIISNSL